MWDIPRRQQREKTAKAMTLLELIKAMEVVASKQPSVKMVVENDIFRLNALADARYGVFKILFVHLLLLP